MSDSEQPSPSQERIDPTYQIQVENAKEVDEALVEAASRMVTELRSVNQVEVTPEWLQSIVDSDASHLLVARNPEKQIEGMAVLVVYPTLVNPRALIETIVVDPLERRHGVGEALVSKALSEAKERKVNTVRLATGKDNDAANGLFEKLGGALSEDYYWYDFILSVGPQ